MERAEYSHCKLRPLYLHVGIREVETGGQAIFRGAYDKAFGKLFLTPSKIHASL